MSASLRRNPQEIVDNFKERLRQIEEKSFDINLLIEAGKTLRANVDDLVETIRKWKNESVILDKITEVLSDAYVRISPDGYIIDFNKSACKLFNTTEGYILGKNANVLFLEDWRNFLERSRFFDHQVQTVDGKIITVSSSLTETPNDYVFLMREVDPLHKKEADIGIIAQALDVSSDVIIVTNKQNRILFTNKAFTKHTGYTKDEALGKNPSFLKADYNPKETYQNMWVALNNRKAWSGVLLNKSKDGKILEDYTVITPIMQGDPDVPAYYVSVRRTLHKNENLTMELFK